MYVCMRPYVCVCMWKVFNTHRAGTAPAVPRRPQRELITVVYSILTSMQSRDKQDVVTALYLVGLLAFELPVGIVDEN